MKHRIRICTFFLLFLPLSWAVGDESVEQVLGEAKATYKKADGLQGAWLTTDALIKKAETSLQKGDKATALQLAKKAKTEAELSVRQAEQQQKHWAEPSYIKR